jgi:hypothetical protein
MGTNIRINGRRIGCEGGKKMELTQDRVQFQVFINQEKFFNWPLSKSFWHLYLCAEKNK